MDQIEKKSKGGLYLLVGLAVAVLVVAVLIFASGGGESNAPAADDPIAGSPILDDDSSCPDYSAALGVLNAKYNPEINAFWQAAHDEVKYPSHEATKNLVTTRNDSPLQNYDVELNALRAEYGLGGYVFDENSLSDERLDSNSSDYCQTETTDTFSEEVEQLRQIFDLGGHYKDFVGLNEQHQLAEFVIDNNVPNSSTPWNLNPLDETASQGLADWTEEQKQTVLVSANQHRLNDYFLAFDQLADDYNIGVFEALLTDLEVRYNLSPSWLVGDGELILLNQVYNSGPNADPLNSEINHLTLSHIHGLLTESQTPLE